MIVIDTAVWIDHIRRPVGALGELLLADEIRQHPFVTGEIMLGSVATRRQLAAKLALLPQCQIAPPADILAFIDVEKLAGAGIGLIDAHLLFATQREGDRLWTRDKRLAAQAERFGLGYQPD